MTGSSSDKSSIRVVGHAKAGRLTVFCAPRVRDAGARALEVPCLRPADWQTAVAGKKTQDALGAGPAAAVRTCCSDPAVADQLPFAAAPAQVSNAKGKGKANLAGAAHR